MNTKGLKQLRPGNIDEKNHMSDDHNYWLQLEIRITHVQQFQDVVRQYE